MRFLDQTFEPDFSALTTRLVCWKVWWWFVGFMVRTWVSKTIRDRFFAYRAKHRTAYKSSLALYDTPGGDMGWYSLFPCSLERSQRFSLPLHESVVEYARTVCCAGHDSCSASSRWVRPQRHQPWTVHDGNQNPCNVLSRLGGEHSAEEGCLRRVHLHGGEYRVAFWSLN